MILLKELEQKQERDQKRVKETHVLALLVHTITTLREEEVLLQEAEAILRDRFDNSDDYKVIRHSPNYFAVVHKEQLIASKRDFSS